MHYIVKTSELYHHGVKGQKWGVRRYQNKDGTYTNLGKNRRAFVHETNKVLRKDDSISEYIEKDIDLRKVKERGGLTTEESVECIKAAKNLFAKAKSVEPRITSNIKSIANKNNVKMYGLENRLKQPESIASKIASKSKEKNFSVAASDIKDAIRYTFISDPDNFSKKYENINKSIIDSGYKLYEHKNYFNQYKEGKVNHKALQNVYEDKSGIKFEVQYHTPESQAVKNLKTPLYEESRKFNTTESRRNDINKIMRELADLVKDPK